MTLYFKRISDYYKYIVNLYFMRKIIASSIFLSLVALVFIQASSVNAAQKITSSLTSPLTYFKLGGQVVYSFHNRLFPLAKVIVKVTDKNTHQIFTTVTSKNGRYEFLLPKDTYKVKPMEKDRFNFWTQVIALTKNNTDVDFTVHNKDKDGNR